MELARKDQEMAKKDLVMTTMATQMANMKALLVANGLVPGPSSTTQAPERICACTQLPPPWQKKKTPQTLPVERDIPLNSLAELPRTFVWWVLKTTTALMY
jgi:hypothetical protein